MNARTRAGLRKVRAVAPGSRIRLVAPASGFTRTEFDAGVQELRRLRFDPVFDDRVFERHGYVAGTPASRATQLKHAWADPACDGILAVRGGYGSVQLLPLLAETEVSQPSPAGLIGYSDITSLHIWLNCHLGVVSIHGPMIDRKLSQGPERYDESSFRASLSQTPVGELFPEDLEVVTGGEASGPLFGGTISQILGSLSTPYAFDPPREYVLFLDEVGERPYRLDRMCVQLRQSGLLARASAVVVGDLPGCDEPDGQVKGRSVVADALRDFPGPVLLGFPSGHTPRRLLTLPFGVHTRVVTSGVVVEEAAVL